MQLRLLLTPLKRKPHQMLLLRPPQMRKRKQRLMPKLSLHKPLPISLLLPLHNSLLSRLQMKPPPSWLPMHLLQRKLLRMLVRLQLPKRLPPLLPQPRRQPPISPLSMPQRRLKQQPMPLPLKPKYKP